MLKPSREAFHQKAHFFCLMLMAAGLPLSMFVMSISGLLLTLNWLAWGNPLDRFRVFLSDRAAVVFTALFAVHLIGVLFSEDLSQAAKDIRIKLPLLMYPIVLSSTPKLRQQRWRLLLLVFIAAVFLSTLYSYALYKGWASRPGQVDDFRDLSPFISHIRLSLMVCMALAVLCGVMLGSWRLGIKLLAAGGIAWLLWFLNIIQSATGFLVLIALSVVFLMVFFNRIPSNKARIAAWLVVFWPLGWIGYQAYEYFFQRDPHTPAAVATHTVNGEKYHHDWAQHVTENGHYVFLNLAKGELDREWPKRSSLRLDSLDANQFPIRGRVYRYMTSLDLPKDSAGVWTLTDADLKAIAEGRTNVLENQQSGLKKRLTTLFLEFDAYRSGNVNGTSLMQRLEYIRTGWQIFRKHLWTGVGTGDLQVAFNQEYENSGSSLDPKFRLRAHNQYLSFFIAFGLAGGLICILAILLPAFMKQKWKDPLLKAFMTIALISFLAEDTLETQAGVSFFIFFYALLIWGKESTPQENGKPGLQDKPKFA